MLVLLVLLVLLLLLLLLLLSLLLLLFHITATIAILVTMSSMFVAIVHDGEQNNLDINCRHTPSHHRRNFAMTTEVVRRNDRIRQMLQLGECLKIVMKVDKWLGKISELQRMVHDLNGSMCQLDHWTFHNKTLGDIYPLKLKQTMHGSRRTQHGRKTDK